MPTPNTKAAPTKAATTSPLLSASEVVACKRDSLAIRQTKACYTPHVEMRTDVGAGADEQLLTWPGTLSSPQAVQGCSHPFSGCPSVQFVI